MLAIMLLQAAQGKVPASLAEQWHAFISALQSIGATWFAHSGQWPMRFFTNIDYHQFFIISAFIFCLGFYGVAARRNAISMLAALELMLNAVNINMSAFNQYWGPVLTRAAFTSEESVYSDLGQCFSAFAIIIAAAEVAIGLAIIIAFYRMRRSIMLDDANMLKW